MKKGKGDVAAAPVGWYRPDTWRRLKKIIPDPENYFDTYEEWAAHAEKLLKGLTDQGIPAEKCFIDPDEMLAWANSQNRKLDSRARSEYAAIVYMKAHPENN